ncbi:hypothetical protein CENSYa_0805 [Cenarchaeum symbiosum A]|uniref:Uncharacterized protein n=1 Tax=Cenarchaeum symbiosum (strain A) TaxID=414004 RepID=A0RVS1_CENSY|nr:hypothetical protein CENSYa_0805 [Cenarchaeum symbiosum A]
MAPDHHNPVKTTVLRGVGHRQNRDSSHLNSFVSAGGVVCPLLRKAVFLARIPPRLLFPVQFLPAGVQCRHTGHLGQAIPWDVWRTVASQKCGECRSGA